MNIFIAVAVVIFVFVVMVIIQPDDFKIVRSVSISAPPAVIFPYVNDLHKWQEFSSWAKIDPAAKGAYEGPPSGVGAIFRWDGNKKVGAGGMTIIESRPVELVRYQLDFLRPFKGTNIADFTFKPEGAQTTVEWTMTGKCHFVMKAMSLFIDCDKMIATQFDKGLADLKSLAEAAAKK
jgi:hypothetical protein